MLTWQPIVTAPKDGTYFLAFPALMAVPLVLVWDGQLNDFRVALTQKTPPFRPQVWMPLPPLPQSE